MASLTISGQHIAQQDAVVKHYGNNIKLSTLSNDTVIETVQETIATP